MDFFNVSSFSVDKTIMKGSILTVIFLIWAISSLCVPGDAKAQTLGWIPDIETERYLSDLFAGVSDNYSCPAADNRPVIIPEGTHLEACIRKFTDNTRWPINCRDAAQITKIECLDERITSLEGLQQFVNLESLSFGLKGTEISDLAPIRNLKRLHTLIIPNSKIKDTAFLSRLTNLKNLDLKGNSVTDLRFMPFLANLEALSLEYQGPNYIRDASPLQYLTRLRVLSLQGNKITDIAPLGYLSNLSYLNLRDNRISDGAPLIFLTKIDSLNISVNIIRDISFVSSMTNLMSFSANSNRITDISPLINLEKLRQTNLKGNAISDISPLGEKKYLRSASLDFNIITNITPFREITLYGNLQELGLAYNCIPEENFREIFYLERIKLLRRDHQCENYPPENVFPDNATLVNGDLVGAKDFRGPEDEPLPKYEATAGISCSAGSAGSFSDLIYFMVVALTILKRLTRKKS